MLQEGAIREARAAYGPCVVRTQEYFEMLLASCSRTCVWVVYFLREIRSAARFMKEVMRRGVERLPVGSSHFFGRRSWNHFKVLLGCRLEQPVLEQGLVPVRTLIRPYVTPVSAVNNCSCFTRLSKGTNCYLQRELLFASRQHLVNNTTF